MNENLHQILERRKRKKEERLASQYNRVMVEAGWIVEELQEMRIVTLEMMRDHPELREQTTEHLKSLAKQLTHGW